ncbi:hypothetical protein AB1Y20_006076 [Prymnesium parvum]|uniref:C2HC/C3H-type domain-containing protein n=1 Tax=Prymnesium parvum TaxID=97485 RepID=A0AB34J3P7_PRYPA
MPLPSMPCPSCGKAFFPSAMKFHTPQCERKQAAMITPCPACGLEVEHARLNAHLSTCARARPPRAPPRRTSTSASSSSSAAATALRSVSIAAAGPDGRVPCAVCQRRFSPDRIAKHQFVCLSRRPPRRAKPPRRAPPPPPPRQRPAVPAWRRQSEELRAAARAARGAARSSSRPAPFDSSRPSSRLAPLHAAHSSRLNSLSAAPPAHRFPERGRPLAGACGGGILPSNLTSADNPLSSMCSHTAPRARW